MRQGQNAAEKSFRQHVLEFWDWFPTVADRFATLLDSKQGDGVVAEVNQQMSTLLPGLSWTFGPSDGGYAFTVTGEGLIAKQLLAEYWLSQAEDVPGWTFYGAKQSSSSESMAAMEIGFGDQPPVGADEFLLETSIDDESERIDIKAWHPAYAQIEQPHQANILFIFLDEALGEFGTQTWLGEITIEPVTEGPNTRTLLELPQFVKSVSEYHHWEKLTPLECYSMYQNHHQFDGPRGDTLFGSTCIPNVICDFLESEGQLPEDPLEGTGAQLAYVAIDGSVFPQGSEVDVRSNIEEAIDDALRAEASGRSLGGAFGMQESYIEFLLLDGQNSYQIIREVLEEMELTELSRIHAMP